MFGESAYACFLVKQRMSIYSMMNEYYVNFGERGGVLGGKYIPLAVASMPVMLYLQVSAM